ncbi:MAG: portal protein [Chloroflexi bacterium RBG_16_51_9]|nr:MAG: portal protein [Chloroflexi bacterium RBG_16_51_9]
MTNFNPQSLSQLDRSRFAGYKANLDFYNGEQWADTSTGKAKNRQLVFNYAKTTIDKITSYLMEGLNFACEPIENQKLKTKNQRLNNKDQRDIAGRAEQVIYDVYNQNNLQELDYETEVDTAILGDGCYKVTWDAQDKRIRVTSPDITGLFAWWLGDDLSKVWRVASRYILNAEELEQLYPSHTGRTDKKTVTITELWTDRQFTLFLDNETIEDKPNPYGFIPFVIFPNVRQPKNFWGTSDIPPLKQAQRELNRALSQLSRILEVSGNPIAVLEGVESAEEIKVQPGAVWTIPEEAKAYLLDLLAGGGIRLHVDYIDMIYRCLHDISESPRAAYGGIERELSGVALEMELQSLLQKVRRKRTIRSAAYARRCNMILKLHKQFAGEDLTGVATRIVWGAVLPQDRARLAQNEQALVQSGVHSRRTAMDELGIRDPEAEFEKWLEERRRILEMNQQFRARSNRGSERERTAAADVEGIE